MARASAKSGEAELLARGNPTLPRALRNAHDLKPGTRFTIIDLGGGSRMLVPRRLRVDALAEPLLDALSARGKSLPVNAHVERVNPNSVPVQQRLLVRISVPAMDGFRPLSTPRYQTVSPEAIQITAEDLMQCR